MRRALGVVGVLLCGAGLASARAADPLTPARHWNVERAAHLLRRAGFGGTPEQVGLLVRLGPREAANYLVDYEKTPQIDADFVAFNEPDASEMRMDLRDASEEERKELRERLHRLHRRQLVELQAWWIRRMIVTPRPLEEKMTLFWHGHFTSGAREVKNSTWMWEQNQFLRTHALGKFRDLLAGITRDPAMMRYLDAAGNRREQPNENYARELMELFTLGEGQYTEQDVKEAARALTGFRLGPDGAVFVPRIHDDGEKTFLGRTGRFDADDILNILLEQPAAGRHLARKLLVFFVEPEPQDELIEAVAEVLRRSSYDFRETMRVLLASEAFYSPRAMHALIKSPVELVVGTVRMLEARPADLYGMAFACQAMGQELFQPPNVKGWDGGTKWITTATLATRYNFAAGLLVGSDEANFRKREKQMARMMQMTADVEENLDDDPGLELQPVQVPLTPQPQYDPLPTLKAARLRTADAVIDHYTRRLLAVPIDQDQRATLRAVLNVGTGPFDSSVRDAGRRVLRLIGAVLSMPEYQVS